MNTAQKLGKGLIIFLAAAGLILGLDYLNIINISKDEAAANKRISEEQTILYEQAVEVARLVKQSREMLVAEAERLKAGKSNAGQYQMHVENVKQYEKMYSDIQQRYNCDYFNICMDPEAGLTAGNPLPASELVAVEKEEVAQKSKETK